MEQGGCGRPIDPRASSGAFNPQVQTVDIDTFLLAPGGGTGSLRVVVTAHSHISCRLSGIDAEAHRDNHFDSPIAVRPALPGRSSTSATAD
jgi:proteasome lid subunit RPN8/RPN11